MGELHLTNNNGDDDGHLAVKQDEGESSTTLLPSAESIAAAAASSPISPTTSSKGNGKHLPPEGEGIILPPVSSSSDDNDGHNNNDRPPPPEDDEEDRSVSPSPPPPPDHPPPPLVEDEQDHEQHDHEGDVDVDERQFYPEEQNLFDISEGNEDDDDPHEEDHGHPHDSNCNQQRNLHPEDQHDQQRQRQRRQQQQRRQQDEEGRQDHHGHDDEGEEGEHEDDEHDDDDDQGEINPYDNYYEYDDESSYFTVGGLSTILEETESDILDESLSSIESDDLKDGSSQGNSSYRKTGEKSYILNGSNNTIEFNFSDSSLKTCWESDGIIMSSYGGTGSTTSTKSPSSTDPLHSSKHQNPRAFSQSWSPVSPAVSPRTQVRRNLVHQRWEAAISPPPSMMVVPPPRSSSDGSINTGCDDSPHSTKLKAAPLQSPSSTQNKKFTIMPLEEDGDHGDTKPARSNPNEVLLRTNKRISDTSISTMGSSSDDDDIKEHPSSTAAAATATIITTRTSADHQTNVTTITTSNRSSSSQPPQSQSQQQQQQSYQHYLPTIPHRRSSGDSAISGTNLDDMVHEINEELQQQRGDDGDTTDDGGATDDEEPIVVNRQGLFDELQQDNEDKKPPPKTCVESATTSTTTTTTAMAAAATTTNKGQQQQPQQPSLFSYLTGERVEFDSDEEDEFTFVSCSTQGESSMMMMSPRNNKLPAATGSTTRSLPGRSRSNSFEEDFFHGEEEGEDDHGTNATAPLPTGTIISPTKKRNRTSTTGSASSTPSSSPGSVTTNKSISPLSTTSRKSLTTSHIRTSMSSDIEDEEDNEHPLPPQHPQPISSLSPLLRSSKAVADAKTNSATDAEQDEQQDQEEEEISVEDLSTTKDTWTGNSKPPSLQTIPEDKSQEEALSLSFEDLSRKVYFNLSKKSLHKALQKQKQYQQHLQQRNQQRRQLQLQLRQQREQSSLSQTYTGQDDRTGIVAGTISTTSSSANKDAGVVDIGGITAETAGTASVAAASSSSSTTTSSSSPSSATNNNLDLDGGLRRRIRFNLSRKQFKEQSKHHQHQEELRRQLVQDGQSKDQGVSKLWGNLDGSQRRINYDTSRQLIQQSMSKPDSRNVHSPQMQQHLRKSWNGTSTGGDDGTTPNSTTTYSIAMIYPIRDTGNKGPILLTAMGDLDGFQRRKNYHTSRQIIHDSISRPGSRNAHSPKPPPGKTQLEGGKKTIQKTLQDVEPTLSSAKDVDTSTISTKQQVGSHQVRDENQHPLSPTTGTRLDGGLRRRLGFDLNRKMLQKSLSNRNLAIGGGSGHGNDNGDKTITHKKQQAKKSASSFSGKSIKKNKKQPGQEEPFKPRSPTTGERMDGGLRRKLGFDINRKMLQKSLSNRHLAIDNHMLFNNEDNNDSNEMSDENIDSGMVDKGNGTASLSWKDSGRNISSSSILDVSTGAMPKSSSSISDTGSGRTRTVKRPTASSMRLSKVSLSKMVKRSLKMSTPNGLLQPIREMSPSKEAQRRNHLIQKHQRRRSDYDTSKKMLQSSFIQSSGILEIVPEGMDKMPTIPTRRGSLENNTSNKDEDIVPSLREVKRHARYEQERRRRIDYDISRNQLQDFFTNTSGRQGETARGIGEGGGQRHISYDMNRKSLQKALSNRNLASNSSTSSSAGPATTQEGRMGIISEVEVDNSNETDDTDAHARITPSSMWTKVAHHGRQGDKMESLTSSSSSTQESSITTSSQSHKIVLVEATMDKDSTNLVTGTNASPMSRTFSEGGEPKKKNLGVRFDATTLDNEDRMKNRNGYQPPPPLLLEHDDNDDWFMELENDATSDRFMARFGSGLPQRSSFETDKGAGVKHDKIKLQQPGYPVEAEQQLQKQPLLSLPTNGRKSEERSCNVSSGGNSNSNITKYHGLKNYERTRQTLEEILYQIDKRRRIVQEVLQEEEQMAYIRPFNYTSKNHDPDAERRFLCTARYDRSQRRKNYELAKQIIKRTYDRRQWNSNVTAGGSNRSTRSIASEDGSGKRSNGLQDALSRKRAQEQRLRKAFTSITGTTPSANRRNPSSITAKSTTSATMGRSLLDANSLFGSLVDTHKRSVGRDHNTATCSICRLMDSIGTIHSPTTSSTHRLSNLLTASRLSSSASSLASSSSTIATNEDDHSSTILSNHPMGMLSTPPQVELARKRLQNALLQSLEVTTARSLAKQGVQK